MAENNGEMELQQKIQKLQNLGAQLQSVAQQRAQLEMVKNESERATRLLGELGDDATVYRSVGSLLVKDDRKAALDRLGDEAETLEIRIKRAKEQETQLQEAFESLQSELQKALQGE